jgi:nucleoside-diphosphate-sugar epimerase
MHFLVTGGAGFIGSHVAEHLLAAGHEVTVFDDHNPFYDPAIKRAALQVLERSGSGRFRFVQGDLVEGYPLGAGLACNGRQFGDIAVHQARRLVRHRPPTGGCAVSLRFARPGFLYSTARLNDGTVLVGLPGVQQWYRL